MIHLLAARAKDLNRKIYASLPWGYRIAGLMLHLASGTTDAVGKAMYAEFLKAGVDGLPPINGEPASSVADKYLGKAHRLPSGYGREFGNKLYATLLSKARNPELVEETLSRLMVNMARGKTAVKPGTELKQAESFVIGAAINLLKDIWREQKVRKQDETLDIDQEGINLSDPSAFRHLENMLPHSELPRIMRDIEAIDPRATSWFEAKLEGLLSSEIADEWGVSKPRLSQWEARVLPKIKEVLMEYLEAA